MKFLPIFLVVLLCAITSNGDLGARRVRTHGLRSAPLQWGLKKEQPAVATGRTSMPIPYGSTGPSGNTGPLPPGNTGPLPPGDLGQLPPTTRPYAFKSADYFIFDPFRNRPLRFFDPEEWVFVNPYVQFPRELDIPFGWSIYNPVTVQAPPPAVVADLARIKYTGYYYACPNNVNPYLYSWYFNNDYVNPCKWHFYQSQRDNIPY